MCGFVLVVTHFCVQHRNLFERIACVMAKGTVKWFHAEKGYGFITPENGGADIFVHYSGIKGKGYRKLEAGQEVEFDIVDGRKGKQAENVVKLTQ